MQPSSNEVCRLGFGPHSLCVLCNTSLILNMFLFRWLVDAFFAEVERNLSQEMTFLCNTGILCKSTDMLYWRSLACEGPVVLLSCWFWCCFDLCFFFKIVCLLVFGDPRCLTATKWTGVAAMSFKGFIGLVVFSNRVAAEWKRRSMVLYTGPLFKN